MKRLWLKEWGSNRPTPPKQSKVFDLLHGLAGDRQALAIALFGAFVRMIIPLVLIGALVALWSLS